jgi:predicted secreted protein
MRKFGKAAFFSILVMGAGGNLLNAATLTTVNVAQAGLADVYEVTDENPSAGFIQEGLAGASDTLITNAGSTLLANASSTSSMSSETGRMRFDLASTVTRGGSAFGASADSSVSLDIAETFTLSGSGSLRVLMNYEFSAEGNRISYFAGIFAPGGVGGLNPSTFQIDVEPVTGFFGGIVEQVFDISAETTPLVLPVLWQLRGQATQVGIGSSNIRASNTATISFEASSGLFVTTADPNFLSATVSDITPVPLPASALLLLAGFSAMSVLGFRRGR